MNDILDARMRLREKAERGLRYLGQRTNKYPNLTRVLKSHMEKDDKLCLIYVNQASMPGSQRKMPESAATASSAFC